MIVGPFNIIGGQAHIVIEYSANVSCVQIFDDVLYITLPMAYPEQNI